ncbi:uncharacterized protein RB166_020261 [Leptodactylus fuscus]|uniref:uncharacterized protein LOC142185400 n=1 Tax=Leptodactylus fuscus TaxID=238119 RepID=UPI003F4F2D8E
MPRFEWIKKVLTCFYNVFRNIVLFYSHGSQRQELTDRIHEEHREKEESGRSRLNSGEEEDTVDFGGNSEVRNALEEVSVAIYETFVSVWHRPPEELKNQPLFKEINSVIQSVFCNIRSRARPLEEYEIIICVITRLIAHFKNKRENKMTYRLKTRQEVVDFVRKHIQRLLDHWLPKSEQRSRPVYVFLTEILSVNVLEPFINNYSEFTFINEAIVLALDDEPAALQKEDSTRFAEVNQDGRCSAPDESNITLESNNISRMKKKFRIKKKLGELVNRSRKRKTDLKDSPKFRSLCSTFNDDSDVADVGSCDDGEDSEDSMTSILDSSLKMWLKNNWTAQISERLAEKEDAYEISVYDESAPETVLWNTTRHVEDFKLLYDQMHQKYPNFKFTKPDTTAGTKREDDRQFFRSIGTSPYDFVNVLVDLLKEYKETEVVFFFSPFEYEDNVRELLRCPSDGDVTTSDEEQVSEEFSTDNESAGDSSNGTIGFRHFNMQNEEGKSNTEEESSSGDLEDTSSVNDNTNECPIGDESITDSYDRENDSKDGYQPDGNACLRLRKKPKKSDKGTSYRALEDRPSTSVTRDEEFPNADNRSEFFSIQPQCPTEMNSTSWNPQEPAHKGFDLTGQNITQSMEQQKKKLQGTLLRVLYELIDEIIAGGKSRVCFLHSMGILKNQSDFILDSIPNIYTEGQIIWYLNQVAELLKSQRPQPLPPDVLQAKAQDLLKNKVQGFLTNSVIKLLFKKEIMKNLKASHQALEDPSANKETLCGLLEDLTKIITNQVRSFDSPSIH